MLAKVKPSVEIDRWRVEGRTVIHRSWAGYTWRKKGSDLAYTAGCHFGPPPPPPPAAVVFWEVAVDGYEPEPFMVVLVFSVKRFDEVRGEFTHRVERIYEGVEMPMLTLEIISVQYNADDLSKTYHIIFGPPEEPFYEEYFTFAVPPFNMGEMAMPNLDHESYTVG